MLSAVNVQARNCEIDAQLRSYFESKLHGLEKLWSHLDDASVRIRHERGQYVTEITLCAGALITRAEERAHDLRQAFDCAVHKLQAQLKRYKSKVQNRARRQNNRDDANGVVLHPIAAPGLTAPATLAAVSMPVAPLETDILGTEGMPHGIDELDGDALMDSALIGDEAPATLVRVKRFALKPMSPDEAALQMDLLGHDFFVFRNCKNNGVEVVYRRSSGGYGLIEPVPD